MTLQSCARSLCLWLLATLPTAALSAQTGATTSRGLEWQPTNWYQAEVVIFTHTQRQSSESTPQNPELGYPDKWLKLVGPSAPIDIGNIAKMFAHTNPERYETLQGLKVEGDVLGTDNDNQRVFESFDPAPLPEPKFELPFVSLGAADRNLNETTGVLRRLPAYRVLFHQAWRFPTTENAKDPWIIVDAGQLFQDRFELEGSLRFYKSRFLHFESHLWLSTFAADGENATPFVFPSLQFKRDTHDENALGKTQQLRTQVLIAPTGPAEADAAFSESNDTLGGLRATTTETRSRISLAGANHLLDSDKSPQLISEQQDLSSVNTYPVSRLWTFKPTKRLRETEVYYLDHPTLGIIVTISAYQPMLLNPEQRPLTGE